MHADPTVITATKLRRDLGAVLDAVHAGRTVLVMRNKRPLCVLSPPPATTDMPPATTHEESHK
jgi:antitoxin (DNA-binding transcriptional repressor) of toxin-antitoxin stability system